MSGVDARGFDFDRLIRKIPHHPREGILFYDLMPLFADPAGLSASVEALADWARPRRPDVVMAAEARGLILGGALAKALGRGFVPARKPGKLPWRTVGREYELEYGTDALEVHRDAIGPGQRVLVHDDLLATGGTAAAACRLVEELGGTVVGLAFVAELTFLPGRERLAGQGYDLASLVEYDSEAVGA